MVDRTDNASMAAGETDDPTVLVESFEAAAGITKGSPVYLSADDKVSPSPGGDDAIGIATKTVLATQMCPVLRKGKVKVVANGAITRGKAVCSAATEIPTRRPSALRLRRPNHRFKDLGALPSAETHVGWQAKKAHLLPPSNRNYG